MWSPGAPYWVEAEGLKLEAACWGPPPSEAATIVLLHEGLGSLALWKDFGPALVAATGCGVFAYSRACYGKSERSALPRKTTYMHHEALVVLPQVLQAIGLEHGVLFGHSDGASIAAIYAGAVADAWLEGVILEAPHFFVEPCTLESARAAARLYRDGGLAEKLARYHSDVEAAFWGWNNAWTSAEFQSWDILDIAAEITLPILIFQGLADPYGTRAQADRLEARVRVESVLLEGIKHTPHVEARNAVLRKIVAFTENLRRPRQMPTLGN